MIAKIQERYAKESACSNLGCGSTIDFLEIRQGEDILDLGSGRGAETIQAAIQTGQNGSATGLDITTEMVEAARLSAQNADITNAQFIYGDIESLPFNDNSFHAVISNCVINHAKNKNKVYQEIMRVLKRGGRFVVSDAVTKVPLPLDIKNDPEAWAQCFGGAITEEEYLQSIQAAGFHKIEILSRREYSKNGFDFSSLTIRAIKQ